MNDGQADLSRRLDVYDMGGLSFREYLWFRTGKKVEPIHLDELLGNAATFCSKVRSYYQPLEFFNDYLKMGYYPFSFEKKKTYKSSIENICSYIIETKLTKYRGVSQENTRKIKALLQVIAGMLPYQVDISKLSTHTRWDGLTKTDALNDAEYSGNLLYLLKMMTGFIKSSTIKRWFKLPEYRLNFPEYADRAILECCVNHLIHRGMTEVGSEVHVDIYDDRIEFYSPGGMFDGTRIQDRDILKVPSIRRNPIIADVFSQLDLMEKRGSGFRKIIDRTAELRLYSPDLAPTFESDSSFFFTTVFSVLYGKTDADFQRIIEEESTPKDENTTPKNEKSTPKTTPKNKKSTPKKLGATSQSILDVLTEDPYLKREEIAARVGLKLEGLKYQLGQLQKKGYLLRKEGRKNGHWKVLVKK